jgi:uncharacterized protein (DUF1015 family)
VRIRAFQALRPPPEIAPRVASLPYDVVDAAEARRLAAGNPHCFFHVSRAEIDLPEGTPAESDAVYAKAAENLHAFVRNGVLQRDPEPRLYVYRLVRDGRAQAGVVAVCHVEDYERNVIRKHEKTRERPERDRTRHIVATGAHTGLVFMAYRDDARVEARVTAAMQGGALYDFEAADGVRHTLWPALDTAGLVEAFASVPCAYIADGHHRAAAAARVARERRAEECNWFLAGLFPATQLCILAYNRCVADLHGLSETGFLQAVRARFTVSDGAAPEPVRPARVSMYLGGRWYELEWSQTPGADVVARLDASVLQSRLLAPVLGIDDPRSNPRIEFVGGIQSADELRRRVDSGRAAVAFSLHPVTMDQIMQVADAGQVMPPKSTWFEPKLRSGLLVHTLD